MSVAAACEMTLTFSENPTPQRNSSAQARHIQFGKFHINVQMSKSSQKKLEILDLGISSTNCIKSCLSEELCSQLKILEISPIACKNKDRRAGTQQNYLKIDNSMNCFQCYTVEQNIDCSGQYTLIVQTRLYS